MTGERALVVALTKQSGAPCVLIGFPRVALLADGRALGFQYARGTDQTGGYARGSRPHRVRMQTGTSAYFVADKYRCDSRFLHVADELRVRAPPTRHEMRLRLPGTTGPAYCDGGGASAPGNLITISAIQRGPFQRRGGIRTHGRGLPPRRLRSAVVTSASFLKRRDDA